MTTSVDLKFSLNAILAIGAILFVAALVGGFWLYVTDLSTSGLQAHYPATKWQELVSATQDVARLKTMCESIAQSLESSTSVIEMQSALVNKVLITFSWIALVFGSLGTLILAFVYWQLRRVVKANAL